MSKKKQAKTTSRRHRMLEHLKFALSPFCWLRCRLGASGSIDIAHYICFAFPPSLVLADAEIVKIQS